MTLDEWAKKTLVFSLPRDVAVWHWTNSNEVIQHIQRVLAEGGDFSQFGRAATGQGLYVSISAMDLMDRGRFVLSATLLEGTRVLVVDPELFGVGFSELLEIAMKQQGFSVQIADFRGKLDKDMARPANMVIDGLMDRLGLSCCMYCLGLHLAFMVRKGQCLRFDPECDPAQSVADYVEAHPKERPMLIPYSAVKQWIAMHARGK